MSAFPTSGTSAIRDNRNNLRLEIARLQAIVTVASDWVEALERDRAELTREIENHRVQQWTVNKKTIIKQVVADALSGSAEADLISKINTSVSLPPSDPNYDVDDDLYTALTAGDRTTLITLLDAAFDNALNTIASKLLEYMRAETSTTRIDGLNVRIGNCLNIDARYKFFTTSQAEMLAVAGAVVGDRAFRTDQNQIYRLTTLPSSVSANWVVV